MTHEDLRKIITQETPISLDLLPDLRALSKRYPYVATLHLLILRLLHQGNDLRFSSELHHRALYIPDLSRLFRLLMESKGGGSTIVHVSSTKEKKTESSFDIIDDFLAQHPEGTSLSEDLFPQSQTGSNRLNEDYLSWQDELPNTEPTSSLDELQDSQEYLISQFLTKGVQAETLPPPPTSTSSSLSSPSYPSEEKEELFTETLARIYIKQGKYDKALRILSSLNLNMSKKSSYFAEQISYLKKLQENT